MEQSATALAVKASNFQKSKLLVMLPFYCSTIATPMKGTTMSEIDETPEVEVEEAEETLAVEEVEETEEVVEAEEVAAVDEEADAESDDVAEVEEVEAEDAE